MAPRISSRSSGPPLSPKQAASNVTFARSRPACAQAAPTLPRMARSSFARPSAAAAWLHGPASPAPKMRPVSSPITAVVPDWPPSTPRKYFMAIGTVLLLCIQSLGECPTPPRGRADRRRRTVRRTPAGSRFRAASTLPAATRRRSVGTGTSSPCGGSGRRSQLRRSDPAVPRTMRASG